MFCMYLATSETKARAKTVSTLPTSSFLQQKFPGLMKRELSVRCALKAWSTGKGKKGKICPPSLLVSFSLSLFYQSFRLLGPPGFGSVVRTGSAPCIFRPDRPAFNRATRHHPGFSCVPVSAYLGSRRAPWTVKIILAGGINAR